MMVRLIFEVEVNEERIKDYLEGNLDFKEDATAFDVLVAEAKSTWEYDNLIGSFTVTGRVEE